MASKAGKLQVPPAEGSVNGDGHLDPAALQADVSVPPVWAGDEAIDYQSLRAPAFVTSPAKKPAAKQKAVSRNVHSHEFIRRYECEESTIPYAVILDKNNRGITLIIPPTLHELLAAHATFANIKLVINHDGELIFLTVPFADRYGNTNEYWTSRRDILAESTARWVKLIANPSTRKYEPDYPIMPIDEPEWPEIDWKMLFAGAFQCRILHEGHRSMRGLIGGKR